jgi:cellulose synthase/poly-beta-1,6-N-acetylglucosamine synthase-like glycosyltransferase
LITGINYISLIIYFTIGWYKVKEFHCQENSFTTKISILIPFRNEENNILNCLEYILKQDFPSHLMEIILIDDHSSDSSLEQAIKYKESKPESNINIIELKKLYPDKGSKKLAIKEGVAASNGELIITTDADCQMNKNWLKYIVAYYEKFKPNMILAPVCFINEHTLFGTMQHLEFLSLQSIGIAAVGNKHPILSNGANLAYKKDVFNAVNGFKNNEDIASGDDVFLLHQFNKMFPGTIHFIKSNEALVFTEPQQNIADFISQRNRWSSKSKLYQDTFAKYTAITVFLFSLSLLSALTFSVFSINILLFFGIFYTAKLVFDFPLLFQITKFVRKKKLLLLLPFLELIYPIYVVFIAILGCFGTYKWKDRRIN